jgi:predicted AlkP superfamily phosphohydrolase/phosphomutase
MESGMRRVVVLGIDGTAYRYLESLASRGKAPVFGKLADEGAMGKLHSTIPPVTPPAWTSMVTGVNPAKHGIFEFQKILRNYERRVVSSGDKKAPEIWDMAPTARCAVANLPVTFPPREINGVMISGMLTPGMESGPARPLDFLQRMKESLPDYEFDVNWVKYVGRPGKLAAKCLFLLEQKKKLLKLLLEEEWDLLFFVVTETDRAQHIMWMDELLQEIYAGVEDILEMLMSLEDCNLFVVSDHGFEAVEKRVHVNRVLEEAGLLRLRGEGRKRRRKVVEGARRGLKGSLRSGWGAWLMEKVPGSLLDDLLERIVAGLADTSSLLETVDMRKTLCFATGMGCLYINRKGRFDEGVVDEREYRRALEWVTEILEGYRDPASGDPVFRRVVPARELYRGPHLEEGPDLLLEPAPGYSLSPAFSDVVVEELEDGRGDHHPEGIFLAYGPDVSPGVVEDAEVRDLAPTILHFLGRGIPRRLEGRPLVEIIVEGGSVSREPRWVEDDLVQTTRERIRRLRKTGAV